ncbi:hypothetical protein CHS0354_029416 [Potamilus streckersoni]|uniref:Uncharacterized protein n=1 Tax=Potamilus streckersoni TaxID=2493646 RepID=A0AAE0STG0_9BIVA|nr:hypothetical protein CHS0354_029416 [Potamilus streckersoni]
MKASHENQFRRVSSVEQGPTTPCLLKKQAARWVQHVEVVLNQTQSDEPVHLLPSDDINVINIGTTIKGQTIAAIKVMKSVKSHWIDSLQAEVLKVHITTPGSAKELDFVD